MDRLYGDHAARSEAFLPQNTTPSLRAAEGVVLDRITCCAVVARLLPSDEHVPGVLRVDPAVAPEGSRGVGGA